MNPIDTAFKKIVQGAEITFLGKVGSTGIKYVTQVVLAQLLGAQLFGLYALGLTINQFGELFARLGLDNGASRYVSIYYSKGDSHRLKGILLLAVGLPFCMGLMLGTAFFFAADDIARVIFSKPHLAPILRIFAIAFPFGATATVGAFTSTGFQVTTYFVYIRELILPLTNLLVAVFLCLLGLQLWGATIAWLIAVIAGWLATLHFIRRLFPDIGKRSVKPIFELKQLLAFSLPLSLGSFLWLVLLWSDILMLGFFRSAAQVGIYRAASQTALLMTLFYQSIRSIFTPMIAELHDKKEMGRLGELFQTTTRWSFALSLPLFLVAAIASKDILSVFGIEFVAGWLPLVVLAAGQLVRAATGATIDMLTMSGHQYLRLFGDIGAVIANVTLNMLLIPRWGLVGAAVATGISIAGIHVLRVVQVKLVLDVHPLHWTYLKIIVAGGIAGLSGYAVQAWFLNLPALLSIAVTTATIVLVYALALWQMGVEEADWAILERVTHFKRPVPQSV